MKCNGKYKQWNKRDDKLLTKLYHNGFSWSSISSKIGNTNSQKCKYRWLNHLMDHPDHRRKQYIIWSKSEDTLLLKLRKEGFSWVGVSKRMNRTTKQCRERWTNHLDPYIIKGNWTELEDSIIICYRRIYGNKWTKISEMLPRRSCDSIKHRWHRLSKQEDVNTDIIEPIPFNEQCYKPIDSDILDVLANVN